MTRLRVILAIVLLMAVIADHFVFGGRFGGWLMMGAFVLLALSLATNLRDVRTIER